MIPCYLCGSTEGVRMLKHGVDAELRDGKVVYIRYEFKPTCQGCWNDDVREEIAKCTTYAPNAE